MTARAPSRFRRGPIRRYLTFSATALVLALWITSAAYSPWISTGNWARGPRLDLGICRGVIVLQAWSLVAQPEAPSLAWDRADRVAIPGSGMLWWFGRLKSWVVGSLHWAPLWVVALPLAFLSWRSWQRGPESGQCSCCGYELAGLIQGPCPECGAPFSA